MQKVIRYDFGQKISIKENEEVHKIAVSWIETGMVLIKDNDGLESAIKKAEKTLDAIPLPEGEYLNNSFQIDKDTTRLLHKMRKELP